MAVRTIEGSTRINQNHFRSGTVAGQNFSGIVKRSLPKAPSRLEMIHEEKPLVTRVVERVSGELASLSMQAEQFCSFYHSDPMAKSVLSKAGLLVPEARFTCKIVQQALNSHNFGALQVHLVGLLNSERFAEAMGIEKLMPKGPFKDNALCSIAAALYLRKNLKDGTVFLRQVQQRSKIDQTLHTCATLLAGNGMYRESSFLVLGLAPDEKVKAVKALSLIATQRGDVDEAEGYFSAIEDPAIKMSLYYENFLAKHPWIGLGCHCLSRCSSLFASLFSTGVK